MRTLYLVLFVIFWTVNVFAQESSKIQDDSILTLDKIFGSNEFGSKRFSKTKWTKDGNAYTLLEKSDNPEGSEDIVLYDTETGKRQIIVPADKIIPPGGQIPFEIDDYELSTDLKKVLVFTNTKRVWRENTRGDYWLLDLKTWNFKKLGGDAKPSTLMFATFSPDGKKVGYVIENNLYVESIETGSIIKLTKDGSRTIINATFDWVYEEELDLQNGFRWSPDSKSIAYWQLDAEGVRDFYLINNTDSLYSFVIPVQYPKAGETNSACRIGVVSADGGNTTWMRLDGDSRNYYIVEMEWAENSDEIVFQKLNRLQNTNWVMLGEAKTGNVKTILVEKDDAWVDVRSSEINWLENGKRFLWVSERDGWRHAYLISRTGDEIKLITPGDYDVVSISAIDEKSGWLYYIASPDNPTQRYLFRMSIDGKGNAERLTPINQEGYSRYNISPNSKWAFHTYSSFDNPSVTNLVSLPDHKILRTLVDNSVLNSKINNLKRKPVEFFRVDIGDGIQLDGWCMKPYNFDPSKKYPVLFNVYGEPAGQTVLDQWSRNYLWHLMLTQQGYIVMSIDNRGTPAPRGREWRKSIYRQIGILASQDQAAALQAIIKKWSYVDPERIGIWGWSGGGSMSLNMIFRYPDLYRTAISVAPVGNQRFYDTIYQERYMGLPKDNIDGYRDGSPVTFAHQLKGNLLIVHGTADDNVHYQNTEVVINSLIEANKRFTMMAYPNRSHGIYEGKNIRRHLYELLTGYLHENLPAGPR